MTWEEFFAGLKGKDKELLAELENLGKDLGLAKLYLIYMNHREAVWGLRAPGEINESAVNEKLQKFVIENVNFGEEFEIIILYNELKEVEYILAKAALKCEILDVNENTGQVFLIAGLLQKSQAKYILTHLLPWVKEVIADNPNNIAVSDKAARKILSILKENSVSESGGLRFGIVSGGCSGYQYEIKPEMKPDEADEIFENDFEEGGNKYKIRIFVNQTSLPYLKGTTIDWGPVEHLMGEGFIINNPNKKGSCGCGKSVEL